jgi:hypothetical protein
VELREVAQAQHATGILAGARERGQEDRHQEAMIATTTRTSISVKPCLHRERPGARLSPIRRAALILLVATVWLNIRPDSP